MTAREQSSREEKRLLEKDTLTAACRYVCADDIGGMVQRITNLPPIFQQFTASQGQVWEKAQCAEVLRRLAFEIWDSTREQVDAKGISRSVQTITE